MMKNRTTTHLQIRYVKIKFVLTMGLFILLLGVATWYIWLTYYSANQLINAANSRKSKRIELLLMFGADPNIPDDRGFAPIYFTIPIFEPFKKDESITCTKILLEGGADVDLIDANGMTALILAAYGGHTSTVNLLISYKANLDKLDQNGISALSYAINRQHLEIIEALLEAGANPNLRDSSGYTPLHTTVFSAYRPSVLIAETIIGHGGDVNATDNDGQTPLHAAVSDGHHIKLIKFLLSNGADPCIIDQDGRKAIDLAKDDKVANIILQFIGTRATTVGAEGQIP